MQITNITASYSRKLNHEYYGGGKFESSDHFVSLAAELDDGEDIITAQKELKAACREMIEQDVADEITGLTGGLPWATFETYLRDLVARRPIDPETYNQANKQQKMILQAAKRGIQMNKRDNTKTDTIHHSMQ